MTNPIKVAESLTADSRELLNQCGEHWFAAADLSWSRAVGATGHALSRMAARGLLDRASDETTWGRSKYRLTPLGLAVRDILRSHP